MPLKVALLFVRLRGGVVVPLVSRGERVRGSHMKVDIEKSPTAAAVVRVILLIGAATSAVGGIVSIYRFALTPPGLATVMIAVFLLLLFLIVRTTFVANERRQRR
jgi:hypothetical protein